MSIKRFIITKTGYFYDKKDKTFCPRAECVLKWLNDLNDENEQLKKDLVRTKVVLDSLQETYSELLKIIPKG